MHLQKIDPSANYQGESGRCTGKGVGSVLERLIVSVFDSANAFLLLAEGPDGSGASATVQTLFTAASVPNGIYTVEVNAVSRKGNWSVGTGSGNRVVVVTPHPKTTT